MSDDLRTRLAAALREICFGLSPGRHYGLSGNEVEQAAEQLLPTVQGELEWWHKARHDDLDQIRRLSAERDAALATLARVRELHQPAADGRNGWSPDDDDTPGAYGHIASACRACGSEDDAVRWPCPTVQAIDAALAGPAGSGSTQDGA